MSKEDVYTYINHPQDDKYLYRVILLNTDSLRFICESLFQLHGKKNLLEKHWREKLRICQSEGWEHIYRANASDNSKCLFFRKPIPK